MSVSFKKTNAPNGVYGPVSFLCDIVVTDGEIMLKVRSQGDGDYELSDDGASISFIPTAALVEPGPLGGEPKGIE